MVKVYLEVEGDIDDVVQQLHRISGMWLVGELKPSGVSPAAPYDGAPEAAAIVEPETGVAPAALPPDGWREELAADIATRLDPVARRVVSQVWRAGTVGSIDGSCSSARI